MQGTPTQRAAAAPAQNSGLPGGAQQGLLQAQQQQLAPGKRGWGPKVGRSPPGCRVMAGLPLRGAGGWGSPRDGSRSALMARKAARSRSSMAGPPRGVGVLWRHWGQGIQRCSWAAVSSRLTQAWQKVWPQ